jgi:hypothetical protein
VNSDIGQLDTIDGFSDYVAERRANRVSKSDMGNNTLTKECIHAVLGAINKLVWQANCRAHNP